MTAITWPKLFIWLAVLFAVCWVLETIFPTLPIIAALIPLIVLCYLLYLATQTP